MARYKPKSGRLEARKTLSFTRAEMRILLRAARLEGMTFSGWAREVLTRAAERKAG